MNPKLFFTLLLVLIFADARHAGAGEIVVPVPEPEFTSEAAKKIIAFAEAGDTAKALNAARGAVAADANNVEARMLMGLLLAEHGDYAQALEALQGCIQKKDTDLAVFLLMARMHEERGDLGPGGARIRGVVRYTKTPEGIDEKAFSAEQFRSAAECYGRALALQPTLRPAQAKRVLLLRHAGDAQASYDAAKAYVNAGSGDAELWLQLAKSAESLRLWPEAREAAERCLSLNRSEPEAYSVLASVCEQEGKPDEAKTWGRKMKFHAAVPDFFMVPYSEENYALVRHVLERPEEAPGSGDAPDAAAKRSEWRKNARAAIDALLAQKTETSNQLLGAIALGHEWHGAVEERIYAELEARKAEALLVTLLRKAQAACTVGGCAPALARLRSEAAFPLILEMLPNDRGMFMMGIPEALAIYGREEAVEPLAEMLRDAIGQMTRERDGRDNPMMSMGTGVFTMRCLWALGAFRTPVARKALEDAARVDFCETTATAALFMQTREKRYFETVMAQLKKNPGGAESVAFRFREAGLPEADAVDVIVKAEQEREKKEEELKKAKAGKTE